MEQFFRHTTSLLRTALLLGVVALFNSQPSSAQTDAQWANMPDGFETIKNPVADEWYYIQFNINGMYPFLGEFGEGAVMRSRDYMPFSKNIQWALEDAGFNSENKQLYRLKSKNGFYVCSDGNNFISSKIQTPTLFQLKGRGSLLIPGYYELTVDGTRQSLSRGGSTDEWTDIVRNGDNVRQNLFRFAKLKSTAAHIIYYRQEHNDGNDNNAANVTTTRHYLTYSGTGNSTVDPDWSWKDSEISSRRSIIPNDKSLWSLPTAAVYHQDGLWALEETGTNGDFYIKKYGTEEYLNGVDAGWGYYSDLDTKDDEFGIFSLESPEANRYTRIITKSKLDADLFHQWDYNVASPQYSTPNGSAYAESHFNEPLNANDLVIGSGSVLYTVFADLTGYTKMIIKGTPNMQLRVLFNRLEVGNGGGDGHGGALTERNPVIGNDGTVELDLTEFSYVHLNAIKIGYGNAGTVSSITLARSDKKIPRHLNSAHGDGWYTLQWHEDNGDDWYAGFYPVEVPVSQKDEFFEVLVGIPVIEGNPMLNYDGGATWPYSEQENERILWKLEQEDNYTNFRLKHPTNGRYLSDAWKMTQPNDPDGTIPTDIGNGEVEYRKAQVNPNTKFFTDFSLKWFYVDPATLAQKEIRVVKDNDGGLWTVRHRESYLRTYAATTVIEDQDGLRKQGLATDADSEWKERRDDIGFTDNDDGFIQKTNHFEITHYVKKGDTKVVDFPTVLNRNSDHILYQRWYKYNDNEDIPDRVTEEDLEDLKAHVSLDTRDDGDVQYFLYKNGMVTGEQLDWTGIVNGGMARFARRKFNFTNTNGQPFIVGADVSRYSDYEYQNSSSHLNGDLKEPSLTMRYLFRMKDAKEMAANLTDCPEGSGNWLEKKEIHFGRTQVPYTKYKKVGYRGEFIGIRHLFSDYWVYDDPNLITKDANGNVVINTYYINSTYGNQADINDFLDQHLVSAVNNNEGGKIEVEVLPGNTGIRKGGYNPNIDLRGYTDEGNDEDYEGYYFYDLIARNKKTEYGNSRFIVFRYPEADENGIVQVANCGPENPAYVNVYLNYDGARYQIAQFKIIFDANMATRPWTKMNNGLHYANGVDCVKDTNRDPNELRKKAGPPIAKITFDYPEGEGNTYHFPDDGITRHDGGTHAAEGEIANSSPVPLTFAHTNYAFDGDGCNWGSYALVTGKSTIWGNGKTVVPADDDDHGYGVDADPGMQKAFMYSDASEQPGDICAVEFEGEFCANDELMCTGWISGSNRYDDDGEYRCPGSITLTVKGEDENGISNVIYRFCPGQIYELDDGYQKEGGDEDDIAGVDGSGNGATHVVWQQFFFQFSTDQRYERYWLEVNNNCVSSNGGDFMLDNIEVYTTVPKVDPEINTPLCVKKDGNDIIYDMQLLKLKVDYGNLIASISKQGNTSQTPYLGFVFLEKETFLKSLRDALGEDVSLETMAERVESGYYDNTIHGGHSGYQAAFDAALLRKDNSTDIWTTDDLNAHQGAGVMYFQWDKTFNNNEPYSFYKAVNKTHATYRTVENGIEYLIMNGNYPQLPWKTDTEYYIVPSNTYITSYGMVYEAFNICSNCSRASVFQIEPPYRVLGLESSESTEDHVVCEGQIPTILLDLKGLDMNGKEIDMKDLNYDWWLGNATTLATLENYHTQHNDNGVYLDIALSTFRTYYPDVTSLDGITKKSDLTDEMIEYLKKLVDAGELVLHQKSVSVPAEKNSEDDPYFYLVACPIHDDKFDQALNPAADQYVSYYCDEPQGLRIKVGQKAPTLKCGFVPGENGFPEYNYPTNTDPVLSIRLAKAAQFEKVKNTDDEIVAGTINKLWLPIRNAKTKTAEGVVKKALDDNIYLASSNDPTWDMKIYEEMSKVNSDKEPIGTLPVVGKIVNLYAKNINGATEEETAALIAAQNGANLLCVYFTENFVVREGYNYTLSLPFQEQGDVNTCDGTVLINLKIVPDYEVWTGAAGNTDWNNDENWRRADGNPANSGLNQDELYVEEAAYDSPLYGYMTNAENYYTKNPRKTSKDQILRKGFAPLYCTHVLLESDEWGNAPRLYDALDSQSGKTSLSASPFPNLRDEDGWDDTEDNDELGTTATPATATPILRYDMQARSYQLWYDTYGSYPVKDGTEGQGDLFAEMYQVNSCDEIAMQPGTELLNAHLLNYNTAWMEYQLDTKRWYLLGSPLQGTISGEWYAPTGTAKQKTTYYDPVKFNDLKPGTTDVARYDRYSPAIYQRSWDKAKAVLYEVESTYDKEDDLQSVEGVPSQGSWTDTGNWEYSGADDYLDRLGYKPFGAKKANVAIKGIWSNTYNDAQVDYGTGGFSVMVMNHLKGNDADVKAIIRLPKEDTMYDYYKFSEDGSDNGETDTYLVNDPDNENNTVQKKGRALNRGRLKTDLLLPTQDGIQKPEKEAATYRYGDRRTLTRIPIKEADLNTMNGGIFSFTEKVAAGASNLGYYLVENPFPCGLDMNAFFAANSGLQKKYWILTKGSDSNPRQQLVQQAGSEWVSPGTGETDFALAEAVVAPGQGFFVQTVVPETPPEQPVKSIDVLFNKNMQAQTRYGVESGTPRSFTIEVGQTQVMEDKEVLVDEDGDGTPETTKTVQVPKVDPATGEYVLEPITQVVTIYNYVQNEDYKFPLKTRGARTEAFLPGLVITAERDNSQSSALVMQRSNASNDFLPEEDTETFINSDLVNAPTVYTLCGRLATTINTVRDFRSLSLGVESTSDVPCTLTFKGVEMLGDSIAFYDAVEKTLTPLESGTTISVSGQTQNRYYLVRGLNLKEAAEETHLQIFTEGLTAKVIASTAEPILVVRCFDTSGRLLYTANPDSAEHSFTLPGKGIYIIEAQTENDRKTKKVMTK